MDNVKRYTATEVRFSTQGGSFVRAADFEKKIAQIDTIAEWYANALNANTVLRGGMAATDAEIGQLKAENELLRKALMDVRESVQREYWDEYAGLDDTRNILDAALGKEPPSV